MNAAVLIYLDANIVIYLIEQPPNLGPRAYNRVSAALTAGDEIALSDLHRFECLVQPIAVADQRRRAPFDRFFAAAYAHVIPVTAQICEQAATIRATQRFSPLDALHLAAAIEASCDVFPTNDRRLLGFTGLRVELLQ